MKYNVVSLAFDDPQMIKANSSDPPKFIGNGKFATVLEQTMNPRLNTDALYFD
jgi:hypothetical protein